MKTINEEIQKIKHLFNFKKGDRLLNEQDPIGDDPNAGEIQKYLVDKGYLPRYRTENGVKKDNIDWDFGDTSAKAFGDFIKDKLGVDVFIQSLQDLQDYLDLLGFDTGSLGFGEKVYSAIKWVIDFTEKGISTIVNTPEYNKIIKSISNVFLKGLEGLKAAEIDKDGTYVCDYNVKYNPTLSNVEIINFTHNTIDIRSRISGNFRFNLCDPFGSWLHKTKKNNFEVIVEGQLSYYFEVTEGKLCLKIEVNSVEASSVSTIHLKTIYTPCKYTFKVDLEKNVVNLHIISAPCGPGGFGGTDVIHIHTIPLKDKINQKICSKGYCIKIDDIVKLIRGQEDISSIPNLMVDMCPPKPKKKKTTKSKKTNLGHEIDWSKSPPSYSDQQTTYAW